MMTSSLPAGGKDYPATEGDFSEDQMNEMLAAFQVPANPDARVPAVPSAASLHAAPPGPDPQSAAFDAFATRFPNSVQPSVPGAPPVATQRTKSAPVVASARREPALDTNTTVGSDASENSSVEANQKAEELQVRTLKLKQCVALAMQAIKASIDDETTAPVKPTRFELKWEKALRQSKKTPAVLCERIAELGNTGNPQSVGILQPFAHTRMKRVRFQTAKALRNVGTPEANRVLLSLLKDPKSDVARAAMKGIVRNADKTTLPSIMAYGLLGAATRAAVQKEFSKLPKDAAMSEQLFGIAENDDSETGVFALQIAARLGDRKLINRLAPFAKHHLPEFRRVAIDCLVGTENQQVVRFLNVALKDPDAQVRARAAAGLSKWTSGNSPQLLLRLLSDNSVSVRRNAAAALKDVAKPEFADKIVELLNTEEDTAIVLSLIGAVGRTGSKDAARKLYPFTRRPEPELRIAALSALVRVKDRKAIPALVRLLGDADSEIRLKAINGLGLEGNIVALDDLERLLRDDRTVAVRAAAARAMGNIGSDASIEPLAEAMADETSVRCQAVIALRQIGSKRTVRILIERLSDSAPDVRYNAASALGAAKDRDSIPALRRLVEDPDEMVRRAVHKALAAMGISASTDLRKRRFARLAGSLKEQFLSRNTIAALAVLLVSGIGLAFFFAPKSLGFSSGPPIIIRSTLQVSMSPNGKHLVLLRERGVVESWSATSGKLVSRLSAAQTPAGVLFPLDSQSLFLLASGQNTIWDLNPDHEPTKGTRTYKRMQRVVASNLSRSVVLTASASGGDAHLWDANRRPTPFRMPTTYNRAVAINPDGTQIVGVSSKNNVALLDMDAKIVGSFTVPTEHPGASVTSVAYGPDGKQIAIGFVHGEVSIIDIESGNIDTRVPAGPKVTGLVWLQDDRMIVAHPAGLTFFSEKGEPSKLDDIPMQDINQLSVTPDGRTLALGSTEVRDIAIVDTMAQKLLHSIKITD